MKRQVTTQDKVAFMPTVSAVLQRSVVSPLAMPYAPPIVHNVLHSSGQPLDAGTRAYMELRFGHDFSSVRVHTDARAAQSARAVDAQAYAVGKNVVFGPGQFNPHTSVGRRLLAHELVHTVQQRNAEGQTQSEPAAAEAEAHSDVAALDKPAGPAGSLSIGAFAPGLYRQSVGSPAPAPTAATGMTEAEFSRAMRNRYAVATIRTGTEAEQTDEVASRVRQSASAITLPQWQSWNPGASSQVYNLILESMADFENDIGGVPSIQRVVFYNTEYDVNLNPAGAAIAQLAPDVGASFGGGVLTLYRALTARNKALPIARSNSRGNYPRIVIGVGGVPGQTPGAPLPLPSRAESIRRQVTHELGHGLAEAAMSLDANMFDDYRQEVGWTAAHPPQLFDIGQQTVRAAFASGSPPPAQFEITVNNWNAPQWNEQPVSDYMVQGGPSEDFAEAVMTFIREPDLLRSRSPRRFQFLLTRKDHWLPALHRVPPVGDFPAPRGDTRMA